MTTITLFVVHLGYLGTGMLIVRLIEKQHFSFRLRRLLVAYLVGIVCQVLLLYAVAALGPVPHSLATALTVLGLFAWAGLSVPSMVLWWVRPDRGPPAPVWHFDLRPSQIILPAVLLLLMLPPLLSNVIISGNVPLFGGDGLAIWSTKAVALFDGEYLRSEFFVDVDRVHAHQGYPLGLPLFEFHQQAVQGQFLDISITRTLGICLVIWFVALFDVVGEFAGRTIGIAACVILMYIPVFYSPKELAHPLSGFADFPVAALVVLASAWFNSWLATGERINLLGAAAAMTALVGVKNEGGVWAVLILFLGVVSIAVIRPKIQTPDIAMLVFPIMALVVLRVVHSHLPTSSDVRFPTLNEIARLIDVVPQMIDDGMTRWRNRAHLVGSLPFLVVIGYGMGAIRQWRNRKMIPALIGPAMWLTIFVVLGLTEVQLGNLDYYAEVTFPRLLFQALPVSLYWVIVLNSQFSGGLDGDNRFIQTRRKTE